MTIVRVEPQAIVEGIYSLAEAIMCGNASDYFSKKPDQRKEQAIKLDGIKEIAEHSTADFIEIPHETLILFVEYLPKTQLKETKNDNT